MRRAELTVLLPPAEQLTSGDIISRSYPLVINGSVHTPMVYVEDIYISPGNGVLDVKMTGEGVHERRHTIGVGNSVLPQAAATEMQPLEITLMNLNTDAAVYVVIVISALELASTGAPVTFGGAVRFRGATPLGTSGVREVSYDDRDNNKSVIADGPLWRATLTTNAAVEVRNIRDITSQVRILSPTGTGSIPVSGGTKRMIIVKKDGVTMEVETESLDFRNIFDLDLPTTGNVRILGLLAEAVATAAIKNGAITNPKLAANAVASTNIIDAAVTPAKLDRSYAAPVHTHTIGNVTSLQATLDAKAGLVHSHVTGDVSGLDSALANKAALTHNHSGVYSPVGHTHSSGGTQYVGAVAVDAFGASGVVKQWTFDPVAVARVYTWITLRADGGIGTTATGSLSLQHYNGSTWVNMDIANGVQFDQGVDSSISLLGYLGNPGNRSYRIYWTRTAGTMNVTSGSVLQISLPTDI